MSSIRFVLGLVLVLVGAAAAFWFVLGVTIMPTIRLDGALWVVQRAAWPEGQAPEGATVLALPAAVERGFGDRAALLVSSGDNSVVATVIADPYSKISTSEDGQILVDGSPTKFRTMPGGLKGDVGDNYLALCRAGSCGMPGGAFLIPTDRVLGRVLGFFNAGGFGPIPSYTGVPE